uniref:Scm polycomb group protein like 4 n=1 Tax=Poecilia formosa TaxID=48698 RepID=A0A087Y1H6_POEFO
MSTLSAGLEMQTSTLDAQFIVAPQAKVTGRKRGRPPIRKLDFQSHYVDSLSPLKVPKKRGRKPGFKLKPRTAMPSLANSPPNSTPEPEMGSIPQDAAIVPHSATPQVLTDCRLPEKKQTCAKRLMHESVSSLRCHPDTYVNHVTQAIVNCSSCNKKGFRYIFFSVSYLQIKVVCMGEKQLLSDAVERDGTPYKSTYGKTIFRCLRCEHRLNPSSRLVHFKPTDNSSKEISLQLPVFLLSADTPLPDDFICDPPADKRYTIDLSDSAFNIMASQYQTKPSYIYRSNSCSTPIGLCRQLSSPATFQDGNRTALTPLPDAGEGKRLAGKDPSNWGVEDVVWFIKEADPQALAPHAEAFRKHEIDGDALLLLKSEMMMKYLGLKLGPALKLCYHIDRLRQNR